MPYPFNVSKAARLVVSKLGGELCALLWIHTHNVLQQRNVVWLITNFFGVEDDFLRLSCFCEASNDLVWYICTKVNTKGQRHIMKSDNITQLFATSKLKVR